MIFSPLLWVFVGTFVVGWYLTRKKEDRKGLKKIPGPMAFPLVGNALQLGKDQYKTMNEWTKKYGDIYQFKLGSATNVMISNPKWMKELFFDSTLVGRPFFDGFDLYENGSQKLGIVNSEGELWEVHRRFLLRQLRDFGFGKSAMENLIIEEANETIANFKKLEGKPITDLKSSLTISVINALWTVVSQKRFKHDDPKLLKLVKNMDTVLGGLFESGGIAIFLLLPKLGKIIPELSGYAKVRRMFAEVAAWFEEEVKEHKDTFQEDNIRDFIDCYIAEMKNTADPESTFFGELGERQLVSTLNDIFFAGSDTTSTTIAWAILYLCKFPETQRKLQDEISAVTNNSRNVNTADMPNMPYTIALIDEVLRYSSIVPNGLHHRALEAKEFQGYFIPKDAWVQPNLHYLHYNPEIWGDPENFRPERFLSEDGKKYAKNENLIAFQIGRRQCPGEILARQTVYIFLANIFQRFEIKFDPNQPEPTLEPKVTFLLYPPTYSVIMKDRQQ